MSPSSCDNCQTDRNEYQLVTPPDLIGYVIQTGKALNLTKKDYLVLEAAKAVRQEINFTAWLGVPFKWDDNEAVGVITVQSSLEKASFSENDRALLEFIAIQLSMILKRNKAEADLRQSYQMMEQRVAIEPQICSRLILNSCEKLSTVNMQKLKCLWLRMLRKPQILPKVFFLPT